MGQRSNGEVARSAALWNLAARKRAAVADLRTRPVQPPWPPDEKLGRRTFMTIGPRRGFAARLTLFATLALALAGIGAGCSSEGEKMVESYASTRETVAKAQRQV